MQKSADPSARNTWSGGGDGRRGGGVRVRVSHARARCTSVLPCWAFRFFFSFNVLKII